MPFSKVRLHQTVTNSLFRVNLINFLCVHFFIRLGIFLLILCPLSAWGQELVINEFLSANESGLVDEDGDFEDWIEIYNAGAQSVNLLDYGLSDDEDEPFKWTFPSLSLEPGDFLIVFASDKDRKGSELHANFKIKASGETLTLTNNQGNRLDLLPETSLEDDQSFGHQPDGSGDLFFFSEPTPGASNTSDGVPSQLEPPTFSLEPGFYSESITLEFNHTSDVILRYTTDGSEPTEDSPIYNAGLLQSETKPIITFLKYLQTLVSIIRKAITQKLEPILEDGSLLLRKSTKHMSSM